MFSLFRICSIFMVFATASGIPPASAGGGNAAARSFAQYCSGDLPADRSANFYASLEEAERTLTADNGTAAETALGKAWAAAFRGGGETDAGVRCLGEDATRRWFNTRLELWRRGSTAGLSGGRGSDYTTLYVIAADRGSDGVIEVVSNRPAEDFAGAYHSVEDIIEVDKWMRDYGTLILPEETKIVAAARDALPALQQYASREHAATLAAEAEAFDRPMTQQESEAAQSLDDIGKLAQSMAGVELDTADRQASMLVKRQIDESIALLDKARGLEVAPVLGNPSKPTPSAIRARERGDTLFARGNDDARSLEFRDELYQLSDRYYDWCQCDEKSQRVAAARDRIGPALEARRAERQQQMDKAQAELQQKAEAMQRDIEKMRKTDAEKKSFEDEADALEAELGF